MSAAGAPPPEGGRGRVLWALFEYEIRMLLRDRRTLLITVVAPLVLFPAFILAMRGVQRSEVRRLETAEYVYAVNGSLSEQARVWVSEALARAAAGNGEGGEPAYRFVEWEPGARLSSEEREEAIARGDLHVLVRAFTSDEFRAARRTELPPESADAALPTAEAAGADAVPVLRLLFRGDSDLSRAAADRLGSALSDYRSGERERLYRESGFPVDPAAVASVRAENVASAAREGGALLGLLITPVLLLLMVSGGSLVAADAIVGEKERGTLETLLTSGARRSEIVQAKMLAVVAVGFTVAMVNLLNMLVYLVLGVVELPARMAVELSPLSLVAVTLLLLPLIVLVASVLLLLSGYAKSYKEYQIYFFPVFWLLLLPSLAAALPGMELRSLVAVIPISNVGVALREVMVGRFDWPMLMVVLASTSLAAAGVVALTGRTLSTERLISQSDFDEADALGGAALFPRHVLGWFGGMWVVLLVFSLWFGESVGIRTQVAVNLLGIFLGGSLLMIWRYRLPVREALALRPVRPLVWPAVLIGAPSALLVGNGVAQLADRVLPVPDQVVEAFGQFLLPEGVPLWQIVLFLAVLPGVCEEIAFRGVLLYGLKRYLRPVPLALAVGLIFGIFHVALFRILPTAYMGVVLTAVTLLTGSILPGVLWHALNNASALLPAKMGWVSTDLAVEPWMYGLAVAGLALAFWILWRERTPYPGLKPPEAERRRAAELAGAGA